MGTEQLCREFDLQPLWRVFPLHPETPDQGLELDALFAGRGYDLAAMRRRLREVAGELGVPFGERQRTYNSRRAQELGKWAERQGQGEAFRAAVYRAYFVDGRNIALAEELTCLAGELGLATDEAGRVLAERRCAAEVDADWQRAQTLGVSAVPTLLWRGRRLVGFRPYAELRRLIAG